MRSKYRNHLSVLGRSERSVCHRLLTSSLIMTGESVSGLLVLVGSLGASDEGEAAGEACRDAAAAQSSVSVPGPWRSATWRSSIAESTVTTGSAASGAQVSVRIHNGPILLNKQRMMSTTSKFSLTFVVIVVVWRVVILCIDVDLWGFADRGRLEQHACRHTHTHTSVQFLTG